MTCNTLTVTIIIDLLNIHCSINMYDSKRFYPYKQNNLTYLVYDNNRFDNEECDSEVKLQQECDRIKNVNNVSNTFNMNPLSLTQKYNILQFYT